MSVPRVRLEPARKLITLTRAVRVTWHECDKCLPRSLQAENSPKPRRRMHSCGVALIQDKRGYK